MGNRLGTTRFSAPRTAHGVCLLLWQGPQKKARRREVFPGAGPCLIPGGVAQALPVPVTSLSRVIIANRGAEVNPRNATLGATLGVRIGLDGRA